jgi:chromosome segregation protein
MKQKNIRIKILNSSKNSHEETQNEKMDKTCLANKSNIIDDKKIYNENIIKKEARQLIAKTRHLMENLEINKLKQNSFYEFSGYNPGVTKIFSGIKRCNSSSPIKKKSEKNLNEELNNTNSESNTLKRLLEKTKHCKVLEKTLKEKITLIDKLHNKLEKKNEIITKLNDDLLVERRNNLIVEIANLQKKICKKEKEFEEKRKLNESLLGEYKLKINKLCLSNDFLSKKLENLENDLDLMQKNNIILENKILDLEENNSSLKENLNLEISLRFKVQNDSQILNSKLKHLVNLIKNLYDKNYICSEIFTGLLSNTKLFFENTTIQNVTSDERFKKSYSEYN